MDIIEFLNARLNEDEQAARAAIDPNRPGTHWHWVTNANDTPVAVGDLAEAQQHQQVSLRTLEGSPSSVGPLPAVVLHGEEVHPGAGDHIARHDPDRVFREIEAKRGILADHHPVDPCDAHDPGTGLTVPCATLRWLVSVYSDHPDCAPEWVPQT